LLLLLLLLQQLGGAFPNTRPAARVTAGHEENRDATIALRRPGVNDIKRGATYGAGGDTEYGR
jgi:hypothetical protein